MINEIVTSVLALPFSQIIYQVTFYLLTFQVLFSALMVVTLPNLVHNVIFLASTLLGVAGLFLYLNAEFLAMVQVFLYVGGITVLFLFGVMLTYGIADKKIIQNNQFRIPAGILLACLLVMMGSMVMQTTFPLTSGNLTTVGGEPADVTDTLGVSLMSKYVLPFEIVSLLLLMAMIGAIILAKEEK